MIICTVSSASHLFLAKIMAKSAKDQIENVKIVLCLVEEEIPKSAMEYPHFDHIVLAKNLGFKNFYHSIFKYNILEAITSVKGQLFIYLLETFNDEDKFVFLDTDVKILGPFDEINQALQTHPIVLTPQLLSPQEKINHYIDWEQIVSQKGTYNTGFLAINRSEEARSFVYWWSKRLEKYCFNNISYGMFVDQKWMDLAPCFFNVFILKHPGYNAALWNLPEREITLLENGEYRSNGKPLRFFHFIDTEAYWNYEKTSMFMPDREDDFQILLKGYMQQTKEMLLLESANQPWSYDYFTSGEKIVDITRINYRKYYDLFKDYDNPFERSNKTFK